MNALYLLPGTVGGTEIYLQSLLSAFANLQSSDRFVVIVNQESAAAGFVPAAPHFTQVVARVAASHRPARLLYEQTILPLAFWRAPVDVIFNPGFTAPFFALRPQVTVIHDLQFRRHPELFSRADRVAWRFFVDGAIARSQQLIAISQATQGDLNEFYPASVNRTNVVASGVDPRFFEIAWQPDREAPYLLAVSTSHPHKNLDALLRAFARLSREHGRLRLVITGARGFIHEDLERLTHQLNIATAVDLRGWVPREELYRLFAGATALCYPSRFEGFGLPVLEAQAVGLPVVCSDIPVLREVAGDAALFFSIDNNDRADDALVQAVSAVLRDSTLVDQLSTQGRANARRFSWERTAAETLDILRRTAKK